MPPDAIALAPVRAKPLPRFRRAAPDERPAFKLTERDREMLKLLYEFRFLTAEMIEDLVTPVPLSTRQQEALGRLIAARRAKLTPSGTSERQSLYTNRKILHRLKVLYHHGYVQRRKLSDYEAVTYALGNRGADALALYYGVDRQQIDWTQKNREAHEPYIRHGLMISRFRQCLALALQSLPAITLDFWKPSGAFKATVEYPEAARTRDGERTQIVKGGVIPDGYFALTNHENGRTAYFFLEADRSTMTNARYLAKLKAYLHFWKTQVQGGKHPSGMPGFRVLTVTLSDQRKDNLRRTAQDVDPNGKGLNLFWFAYEKSYAATPQELSGTIWQTPQEDTFKSIFAFLTED